jgi:hypothetical protein
LWLESPTADLDNRYRFVIQMSAILSGGHETLI